MKTIFTFSEAEVKEMLIAKVKESYPQKSDDDDDASIVIEDGKPVFSVERTQIPF